MKAYIGHTEPLNQCNHFIIERIVEVVGAEGRAKGNSFPDNQTYQIL